MKFRNDIEEVWVVGAFDRHNYGDLLFPLLVQEAVRSRGFTGPVRFFSTLRSDLRRYGAVPTEGLRAMFRRDARGAMVVVAGGEVLAATWVTIVSYLYQYPLAPAIRRVCNWLGEERSTALLPRLFGAPSKMPFVYSPHDFRGAPLLVYNAVGASHLRTQGDDVRSVVAEKLKKASYVSVRDDVSKSLLESLEVPGVVVSPDSAVLLSSLYPRQQLLQLAGSTAKEAVDSLPGGYVCFQSAHMYIAGREAMVAASLRETVERTGLGIVIIVIGRASGHNDDKAARVLQRTLRPHPGIRIITSGALFDIMFAISRARVYAGTSLHGAITALSYAVPQLGLCPRQIPKLASFIDTWSDSRASAVCEYSQMPHYCRLLADAPAALMTEKRTQLIKAADSNFDAMFSDRSEQSSACAERMAFGA